MNQNVRMVHGCVSVVFYEYVHLIISAEEKSGKTTLLQLWAQHKSTCYMYTDCLVYCSVMSNKLRHLLSEYFLCSYTIDTMTKLWTTQVLLIVQQCFWNWDLTNILVLMPELYIFIKMFTEFFFYTRLLKDLPCMNNVDRI